MDKVFHKWSRNIPLGGGGFWQNDRLIPESPPDRRIVTNIHFHYVTDTPDPFNALYINGTNAL